MGKQDTRRIIIMRHAKSDWDSDAASDFDRPLSRRGERDAPRIGKWLVEQNLAPNLVISSPARRAKETLFLAGRAWKLAKNDVIWEPAVYDASLADLLRVLNEAEIRGILLLVGHNPGMEDLLKYLAGDDLPAASEDKLMPTCGLACLKVPPAPAPLDAGCAEVQCLMQPKLLD